MGKRGLSVVTDKFTEKTIRQIKHGSLEGTIPGNGKTTLSLENGYKINVHGQIIGQKDQPLTQIFRNGNRAPFAYMTLHRKNNDGVIISQPKEVRLDHLMEKYFGPYIEGYSEMKNNPDKEYIVVPKDDNWADMSMGNLKYVIKEEYNLNGTKKALLLELLPFFDGTRSDDELAILLQVSRGWISRVRAELKEQKRLRKDQLHDLIVSHKTYKIYEALLACKGLKSNLDIAKELRSEEDFTTKEKQEILTDKISRVRRKLFDRGLIKKYNTYQQKVNIADVRSKLEKALIANRGVEGDRKTHSEIAETLGLDKQQVDNYSRRMKKKNEKNANEKEGLSAKA